MSLRKYVRSCAGFLLDIIEPLREFQSEPKSADHSAGVQVRHLS